MSLNIKCYITVLRDLMLNDREPVADTEMNGGAGTVPMSKHAQRAYLCVARDLCLNENRVPVAVSEEGIIL